MTTNETIEKQIELLSGLSDLMQKSGLDSDELYYVMKALKGFYVYDSEEDRDSWLVSRGISQYIKQSSKE